MRAYRHLEEGTNCIAYTRDAKGERLPVRGSVWLFVGSIELGLDPAVPAQAIRAGLLRQGYFLWPEDPVSTEPHASND